MYKTILVPIDLAHAGRLEKAIRTAVDLAAHYGSRLLFVGVTAAAPSEVAHNPEEYQKKLADFASATATEAGIAIEALSYVSHDPAIDLDETIFKAAHEHGADLIVMASHVPGFAELIFSSNAGEVAAHADLSVFVVR